MKAAIGLEIAWFKPQPPRYGLWWLLAIPVSAIQEGEKEEPKKGSKNADNGLIGFQVFSLSNLLPLWSSSF
jgi:hypothetical protein